MTLASKKDQSVAAALEHMRRRAKTFSSMTSGDQKGEHTMALNITVHSIAGERYAQVIEAGSHTMIAGRPKKYGGADKGPGPYSYLLAALGA